jgi:probable F420-dependent oxidoreductase
MGLGFGLLSAQLRPGESDWSQAYDETLRAAEAAEQLGFDSVWTTEHHFVDDGYMPSLLVTSAAIAARTTSIEIGTGVVLAPLHHPLRLAEDAATVDLISRGRLILGLGLGWSEAEFAAFGADMRRRGRTMDEVLNILPQAWSGDVFAHRGTEFQLPELAVRPTPRGPIPIVIGGGAEPAIRRAARLADGIFSNAPAAKYLEQVTWARQELERRERDPDSFRWIHYSILYPCEDPERGWEELSDHLWHMTWKYRDMVPSANRPGPPPAAPPLTTDQADKLRERAVIIGTPDQIVEELLEVRAASGVATEFVARSYFATMAYDQQFELMQRLATEIGPHL